MNLETATLTDGRTIKFIPKQIGAGTMKEVFFTEDKQSVLCFYKDQSLSKDSERRTRLEKILKDYNPTITTDQGGQSQTEKEAQAFRTLFCWPTGIVEKPRFGVMAPAYSPNFYFESGTVKGNEKEGKWFASPRCRSVLPLEELGHWLNYLLLCNRMARAVRKMHNMGLAHSDLSSKNILLDPKRGYCSVIDIDSLVVPGIHPADVLGTRDYIAPEVLATQHLPLKDDNRFLPSNNTDLHAMAVLIYEYLLRRHPLSGPKVNSTLSAEEDYRVSMGEKALFIEHPKDGSNRPQELSLTYNVLGPGLRDLFDKAFIEGLHAPNRRPTAGEWERAIAQSLDLSIPCGNKNCKEKWFIYRKGEKPRCPWCGTKIKSRTPVLEFYYMPRDRVISLNHHLTAWNQRTLHEWHVFSDKNFDERADPTILADVAFYQGRWILINRKLEDMFSSKGKPVPIGKATLLEDRNEIWLSKKEKGQLVKVSMIP